jgi:hypothetical protein
VWLRGCLQRVARQRITEALVFRANPAWRGRPWAGRRAGRRERVVGRLPAVRANVGRRVTARKTARGWLNCSQGMRSGRRRRGWRYTPERVGRRLGGAGTERAKGAPRRDGEARGYGGAVEIIPSPWLRNSQRVTPRVVLRHLSRGHWRIVHVRKVLATA